MKEEKRLKGKKLKESDIDEYCKGVEQTLTKIYKRCGNKKSRKKTKKELVYCLEDIMYY